MASYGLPVNVDANYQDNNADPSVKTHQQHHDTIHGFVNKFDAAAAPATGDGLVYSGGLWTSGRPNPRTRDVTMQSVTANTASTALDLSAGVVKFVTLSTATTALSVTNLLSGEVNWLELILKQDSTGARTVTWWSGIKWVGGTAPSLSTAAYAVDRFMLTTYDNAADWFGDVIGQGYA